MHKEAQPFCLRPLEFPNDWRGILKRMPWKRLEIVSTGSKNVIGFRGCTSYSFPISLLAWDYVRFD